MHIDWHKPLILPAASESLVLLTVLNIVLKIQDYLTMLKYEWIGYKVLLFYIPAVVKNLLTITVKAQH